MLGKSFTRTFDFLENSNRATAQYFSHLSLPLLISSIRSDQIGLCTKQVLNQITHHEVINALHCVLVALEQSLNKPDGQNPLIPKGHEVHDAEGWSTLR